MRELYSCSNATRVGAIPIFQPVRELFDENNNTYIHHATCRNIHPKFTTSEIGFKQVPNILLIDDIPNLIKISQTKLYQAKASSPHNLQYFLWASPILMTTAGELPRDRHNWQVKSYSLWLTQNCQNLLSGPFSNNTSIWGKKHIGKNLISSGQCPNDERGEGVKPNSKSLFYKVNF